MTAEVPFGENPFVDPEAQTDTTDPNDWGLTDDWIDVGLPPSSARLRLIKGGAGSTATETIVEAGAEKPVEPWRIDAAAALKSWLLGRNQPHSVAEAAGLILGTPEEAIERLSKENVGVGVFRKEHAEELESALAKHRYVEIKQLRGLFTMTAGSKPNPGELHRHGDGMLIVHFSEQGSGPAKFYWPRHDRKGLDEDFHFDPAVDQTVAYASLRVDEDTVFIFSSSTWHQFGADAHTQRVSRAKTYYKADFAK